MTNCPVKSILQATYTIDKLFLFIWIKEKFYYQNKQNLQWNSNSKHQNKINPKSLANINLLSINFRQYHQPSNEPKTLQFQIKTNIPNHTSTSQYHIRTNFQSSQQTHNRIKQFAIFYSKLWHQSLQLDGSWFQDICTSNWGTCIWLPWRFGVLSIGFPGSVKFEKGVSVSKVFSHLTVMVF